MTFKTEAEVYRYLLEKDGNAVENDNLTRVTFIDGALMAKTVEAISYAPSIGSIRNYGGWWRPLEKKEWWEVAEEGKLLCYFGITLTHIGEFSKYDGRHYSDKYGDTFTCSAPVPSSTIRIWLAEAERVERECNP